MTLPTSLPYILGWGLAFGVVQVGVVGLSGPPLSLVGWGSENVFVNVEGAAVRE